MKTKTIPIFVLLLLLFSIALVNAADVQPEIEAYPPPSRTFPLKIYVYPTDYDEVKHKAFTCPAREELIKMFYSVQKTLYKSILRFVEEHPEFGKLALIQFVNASSLDDADITFRIVVSADDSSYVLVKAERTEIYIECEEIEESGKLGAWNVISTNSCILLAWVIQRGASRI